MKYRKTPNMVISACFPQGQVMEVDQINKSYIKSIGRENSQTVTATIALKWWQKDQKYPL